MRAKFAYLGLPLALAACAGHAPFALPNPAPSSPSPKTADTAAAPRDPDLSALVERAIPAVVLLLNTSADGKTTYGAGLLIEPGMVLTSQHVVAGAHTLGAMLYRPGRTSYTPMDGGLSRFLFENQSEIVNAHELDGDSTTDLAVVRLDADTSRYGTLPIAAREVRPGERVLALGHPQENVWSFTLGVVGSIQQGAIQHDANISHGSSGGPLLNARGEVVGINIAKVTNEPTGLAFARPISLAARYLGERSGAALPLDLSTPQAAAVSCWRAQEIGRVEVGECFDWEAGWEVFFAVANEAARIAPPPARERLRSELAEPDLKARWIEKAKHHAAAYFIEGSNHEAEMPTGAWAVPPEVAQARADAERELAGALQSHPELRGIFADQDKPFQLRARLRLGIRADRTVMVDDHRAWVELAGKNPDGTVYHFSELYVKIGDRWLQRCPPLVPDSETLPSSFAPPLETLASYRAHKLEKLIRDPDYFRSARASSARPAAPSSKASPTGCATDSC